MIAAHQIHATVLHNLFVGPVAVSIVLFVFLALERKGGRFGSCQRDSQIESIVAFGVGRRFKDIALNNVIHIEKTIVLTNIFALK